MHQRKYSLELISELDLAAGKPATTPMDANNKWTTREYDEYINKNISYTSKSRTEDPLLTDVSDYQKLIGKLLYLTVTRPGIIYSVQTLSQFMQQPKKSHMDATMRIVRYVKAQSGQGVLLSSKAIDSMTAFCDADWATCAHTRRSVTRFMIKLGDSMIS